MPKIKLSALVSDIKGKSNGSVFSKNSGGTYFRNNPRSGGTKSARWDKQKNNLSALASQWRSLDLVTQEAWQDATPNYPTLNAFGDPRIPSGYELFMRLNGHLLASNLPLLEIPASPRSTPDPGEMNFEYPLLWQMNPVKAFSNSPKSDYGQLYTITTLTPLAGYSLLDNYTNSFRFQAFAKQSNVIYDDYQFQLFKFMDSTSNGYAVQLRYNNNTTFNVELLGNATGGSFSIIGTVTGDLFEKDWHISVVSKNTAYSAWEIYVNGVLLTTTYTATGTPISIDSDFSPTFDCTTASQKLNCVFSDYRFYNLSLNATNCLFVYRGYFYNSELIAIDFVTNNGGDFINYGSGEADFDMSTTLAMISDKLIIPWSFALVPAYSIKLVNGGLPGLYLNIYASPPTSLGRNLNTSRFRLIKTVEWDTTITFNVFDELKETYGNIPPNSQIMFKVDVLDSTTGNIVLKGTKPKKKTRFKAGADLTEKVN